jgi:hypothetical protein
MVKFAKLETKKKNLIRKKMKKKIIKFFFDFLPDLKVFQQFVNEDSVF